MSDRMVLVLTISQKVYTFLYNIIPWLISDVIYTIIGASIFRTRTFMMYSVFIKASSWHE